MNTPPVKSVIQKKKISIQKKNLIPPRESIDSNTCWFCNVVEDNDIRHTPIHFFPTIGWNCCSNKECKQNLEFSKKKYMKSIDDIKEIFKKKNLPEPKFYYQNGKDLQNKGDIYILRSNGLIEKNWYLASPSIKLYDNKYYIICIKELIKENEEEPYNLCHKKCLLKEILRLQIENKN